MDPSRFDTLVRTLTTGGSRRRLLGVLSALPLVSAALAVVPEDTTAAKGNGKARGTRTEQERQRAAPEATSCARRCRKKASKQARRKCRKRCTPPTPECTTSTDCPNGELCESGVCIPIPDQCSVDTDCDACERCQSGVCVAQCAPDEVCRTNQCESVQCTTDRDCGDCSRCQDGRCRWQCAVTDVCLSGAGGRCCQPRSCPAGTDCGTVDDGCGGQARCGPDTCAGTGQTCGGGGTPNVCGCTPLTTCPDGTNCGTIPDGCGGTVRCGPDTCTQPANPCKQTTCTGNVCITEAGNDGASCDDGDACTQTDTCQGGVCVGGNPVVCPNPDQCHEQGVCNPATGVCSNPNKTDGTACDDGNACTTGSTCSSGTCGGGTTICTAPPVCRTAAGTTCSGGTCTYPAATAGTTCGTVPCGTCDGAGTCVGCQNGGTCSGDVCQCTNSCPTNFVRQANCSCQCPTGYEVVNGGCFKITSNASTCPGCNGGCGCVGSVNGSGNYLCVVQSFGASCSASACATGTACFNSFRCVTPC